MRSSQRTGLPPWLAILGLAVTAAVLYGIAHDQVTARVCLEYFTIGHPRLVATDSPTWIALAWGIVATWWMGVLLGVPLAMAARAGARPKRSPRSLLRPVAILLAVMALCALVAGIAGGVAAANDIVVLVGPVASRIPADAQVGFIADLWAHLTSYAVGFVGGVVVIVSVWRSRARSPREHAGS